MNEELNQELQTEEFADTEEQQVDNEATNTTDEVEEQNVETNEVPEEVNKEFLKIKYNKEEKALTRDEAITYAQKGMNYDHIKEELEKTRNTLEETKNSKALRMLEKYAKTNNMNVEEYANFLEESLNQQKINEIAEKNNISTELAKRLYELEKKDEEREAKALEDKKAREKAEIDKKNFTALSNHFKEVNGREIDVEKDVPDRVFELQQQNDVPIHIAYQLYENEMLRNQLKINKVNETNAKSSVGSVTNEGVGETDEFSQERINKMTPQEMAKYWNNPKFLKAIGVK